MCTGITYSTSEIQRRYLSIVVNDDFVEKTIDAIIKSAQQIKLVMEKYSYYLLKKHTESEQEKKEEAVVELVLNY